MSRRWWRRSRALRALTPTLASALFLMASTPLLAQTTYTITIEVEQSTVIEGETIRYRLRVNPAAPRNLTVEFTVASGIRGTLADGSLSISDNDPIKKNASMSDWLEQGTAVREEDNDDTVTFTPGPRVFGDTANTYEFGNPVRVRVLDPTNAGDPDVNGDDAVTANDALILYYAYALRSDLGNGR